MTAYFLVKPKETYQDWLVGDLMECTWGLEHINWSWNFLNDRFISSADGSDWVQNDVVGRNYGMQKTKPNKNQNKTKKQKDIQVLGRFVGNLWGPGGVQVQTGAPCVAPNVRQLVAWCCQRERVAAVFFISVSFCSSWQGNLVLMLCQKSSNNELLECGEEGLCAVPQAFSGGQQCVSWWADCWIYVAGALLWFLTAFLLYYSGCKHSLTVGSNQEREFTCLWLISLKFQLDSRLTVVSRVNRLNHSSDVSPYYLPRSSTLVGSSNMPFWCL